MAVNRTRVGLASVAAGLLGLATAWWLIDSEGGSGVVGTTAAVVLAAGLLLVASELGEAATRICGGLLCVAGLAVAITQHEVWWWLRAGWETPMTVAALLIAVVGLGVLLFAYGFRMAGLSGACGVLAAAGLLSVALPYNGSEDEAVLRAWAAALGAVALVAGFRAAARPPLAHSLGVGVTLVVAAVLGVAFAGYGAYETYAPIGYRAATVTATVVGIVAVLVIGGLPLRRFRGGLPRPAPDDGVVSPEPGAPAVPTPGPPVRRSPEPAAPTGPSDRPVAVDRTPAVPGAVASAGRSPRNRLETLSLAIGVVIGLITIFKEIIAAVRSLVG
ncbi:hypothetical protein AB0M54_12450 [Actinoplanes sp. NPDC051470]|uniref:hypothetical protein n=1 Tax=Actinoplanes sp. NPDC051470 TaxID=3157224 RepID=UPI003435A659